MNDIRRPILGELHQKREIVIPAGDHPLDREFGLLVEDGYVTEKKTLKHRVFAITDLGDAAHEELEAGAVAEEAERQKRIAEEQAVRRASDEHFKQMAQARARLRKPVKARVVG